MAAEAEKLVAALRAKGSEFMTVVKMGRTELQDAVPMTVGQEFHAFAAALEAEIAFLRQSEKPLLVINMGATAIGSGITAPEGYAERVPVHLAELTGKPFVMAKDMFAATWDQHAFVAESGALKRNRGQAGEDLPATCGLLSSGPRRWRDQPAADASPVRRSCRARSTP